MSSLKQQVEAVKHKFQAQHNYPNATNPPPRYAIICNKHLGAIVYFTHNDKDEEIFLECFDKIYRKYPDEFVFIGQIIFTNNYALVKDIEFMCTYNKLKELEML